MMDNDTTLESTKRKAGRQHGAEGESVGNGPTGAQLRVLDYVSDSLIEETGWAPINEALLARATAQEATGRNAARIAGIAVLVERSPDGSCRVGIVRQGASLSACAEPASRLPAPRSGGGA